MSRRVSLPGADELFRVTGSVADQAGTEGHSDALDPLGASTVRAGTLIGAEVGASDASAGATGGGAEATRTAAPRSSGVRHTGRRRTHDADRQPSGRERHDEKITVYCSAEELIDLEHARLALRGEHGLAVDRGRIVREALAVVIADLDAKGESSILVRRLRGR
ncbi:MAG: hypothetical protein NVSMB13_05290 [Mycobacteriales bacterium]